MYKIVGSFFDGFSGTMLALDKLGITPDEYHAFEIDPYSSAVSLVSNSCIALMIGEIN